MYVFGWWIIIEASFEQIRFRRGLPPGDGVLYYPGEVFSSSHEPVASIRLERILSGLQVLTKQNQSGYPIKGHLHLLLIFLWVSSLHSNICSQSKNRTHGVQLFSDLRLQVNLGYAQPWNIFLILSRQDIEYLKLYSSRYGRDEGLALLDRTGVYLGPERYTSEHMPIDAMRGEIFNGCRT